MLWLNILLIVVSLALTASILVQNRSTGLGGAFGGSTDGMYVRRGSEKRLFQLTIILSTLFLTIAAAHLFVT